MSKYLKIRSKNHTADGLRGKVKTSGRKVVLRLGSITPIEEVFPRPLFMEPIYEINTVQACKNSGNKLVMKRLFQEHDIPTAIYIEGQNFNIDNWEHYPAIIKHKNSSKGNGIFYVENREQIQEFINTHQLNNYVIEKYYTYSKEYRLHVTKDGCFYTCRKMLKQDAEDRWHRHDNNSVWILEENPLFDKPNNWDEIVNQCINAMNAVGLDICSCDVKLQTRQDNPAFIILETNSASSLGEITTIKYIRQLKQMCNEIFNA